jgi:hypothetical protein
VLVAFATFDFAQDVQQLVQNGKVRLLQDQVVNVEIVEKEETAIFEHLVFELLFGVFRVFAFQIRYTLDATTNVGAVLVQPDFVRVVFYVVGFHHFAQLMLVMVRQQTHFHFKDPFCLYKKSKEIA